MAKRLGPPCECSTKHYGKCRGDDKARFAKRVAVGEGCWLWTGGLMATGYGRFWWGGRLGTAHRAAYEMFTGPIPSGMQIDHLCHNSDPECVGGSSCRHRACVNPAHLEAVSQRTNLLRAPLTPTGINHRKTHCSKSDHALSGPNLYVSPRGDRQCRTCRKAAKDAWRDRLKR